MQICSDTISILKNFATINERILIEAGNQLWILAKGAVLGKATVAEIFPLEFGIYSLTNFLNVIGLFKAADCDFQQGFALIRDLAGDSEVRYLYAAPSCVSARPAKLAAVPKKSIEFDLPEQTWVALQRAASVLCKKEVRVLSDGYDLSITTYDHKYPGGNEFSTPLVGTPHGRRCNAVFQIENLKLIKGSYRATVTPNFAVFRNTSGYDLTYWIGCDPESTFE